MGGGVILLRECHGDVQDCPATPRRQTRRARAFDSRAPTLLSLTQLFLMLAIPREFTSSNLLCKRGFLIRHDLVRCRFPSPSITPCSLHVLPPFFVSLVEQRPCR